MLEQNLANVSIWIECINREALPIDFLLFSEIVISSNAVLCFSLQKVILCYLIVVFSTGFYTDLSKET